jgi:hypothetical protein
MSTNIETTRPDPKRPYKAYAAGVGGAVGALLSAGLSLPTWLEVSLTVVAAGITAFLTPNPKKRPPGVISPRRRRRKTRSDSLRNQSGPPTVV